MGTTHGIIIFPDSYTHPDGVAAPTGINATDGSSWSENRYTAADWAKMEAAGCVFLPAAGSRDHDFVDVVDEYGRYWASTYLISRDENAYVMCFENSDMNPAGNSARYYGQSVRLVRDVY